LLSEVLWSSWSGRVVSVTWLLWLDFIAKEFEDSQALDKVVEM